jgi:hypothetical protein
MTSFEALTVDNVELIAQGVHVLERVNSELYDHNHPELHLFGPGANMRHLFDFYSQLLSGIETGRVDYDAHQRDPRIETEPAYAAGRMGELIEGLNNLRSGTVDASTALQIKPDSDGRSPEDTPWTHSSLERELQAVMSHTVHHDALIAVAPRPGEFDPGEEFGVAPSTLRNLREQRECVR